LKLAALSHFGSFMKKNIIIVVSVLAFLTFLFWIGQIRRPVINEMPSTIIVGTSADFQPLSFKQDGKIVGLDIDVITEVCKRLEKPMILKDMPFELLMPQLQLGSIQIIAAGLTETPERSERVQFTIPYLTGSPLLVISLAAKPPIKCIQDLEGKEIIVNQGYTSDLYMSKLPGIHLKRLATVAEAMLSLTHERGDAFVVSAHAIKPYFETHDIGSFNIFTIEETNESASLAVSKDYPILAKKISAIIQDMLEDGTIQQYKDTWHIQ